MLLNPNIVNKEYRPAKIPLYRWESMTQEERVREIRLFKTKEVYVRYTQTISVPVDDVETDMRALAVGLTSIKHNDPCLVSWKVWIGRGMTYTEQTRLISMAQVAEIMAIPSLSRVSAPIEEIDRMIDQAYKNLHGVNLPAHALGVQANTIEFIKHAIRYKREMMRPFGSSLNCLSPSF